MGALFSLIASQTKQGEGETVRTMATLVVVIWNEKINERIRQAPSSLRPCQNIRPKDAGGVHRRSLEEPLDRRPSMGRLRCETCVRVSSTFMVMDVYGRH